MFDTEFNLCLLSKTAWYTWGVLCFFGFISSLYPETFDSSSREKVLFAVEIVKEVFGLLMVEEKPELLFDSRDKIFLADLDFATDFLFRLY